MKKITFFASFALMMVVGMVNANTRDKHRMIATITIDAPAAKVWKLVKNYDDISWQPNIKSAKNIDANANANANGAERILTLANGGTITEQLLDYDETKMTYKYKITGMSVANTIKHAGHDESIPVLPVAGYSAKLAVSDKGGKAEVKWTATYYRASASNDPPEALNEEAADKAVNDMLTTGLTALEKKINPNATSLVAIHHQCPVN